MSERSRALGGLALFLVASFVAAWVVSMSLPRLVDDLAFVLVAGIAPPATLFALLYTFTRPWWTTMIGRAMLISSTGLALLVDISLLYRWLGDDYALRDAVRLTVFWVVCAGAWWKFGALVRRGRATDDRG